MIPQKFKERMRALLGVEYDNFILALEEKDAVRGVRENLIKSKNGALERIMGDKLIPLDYVENGWIFDGAEAVGNHPAHHAGIMYMQDPGAMSTVAAIDIEPSWWVLDTCAAPGGKSSQIAEKLSEDGFLLSNEYVPKRAKIIVGNFERLGVKGAIITSLDTAELRKMYKEVFDLALVDAPCSGEGMFRKSEDALTEWSEENVALCAKRQGEILDNVAPTVKGGGFILYSTCTYSLEENEMTVDAFLNRHPEFELTKVKDEVSRATADGINYQGCKTENIHLTRRFYPHKRQGEGQFIALMRKKNSENMQTFLYKDAAKPLSKEEKVVIEKFFDENLTYTPKGRLVKVGENPVLILHGCPLPPRSVFMSGVLLGEIRSGILHPSHQLFTALGENFKLCEELGNDPQRLTAYLKGEEIPSRNAGRGYVVLTYEGVSLGGGKLSGGRIKNHYPKGLRNK